MKNKTIRIFLISQTIVVLLFLSLTCAKELYPEYFNAAKNESSDTDSRGRKQGGINEN